MQVGGADRNRRGHRRRSPIVDTRSTTIGAVLDSATARRVPVGRRFSDTLYLAPGVSSGGSVGAANPSIGGGERPRQPVRRRRREHHQRRLRRARLVLDRVRLARQRHAVRLRPGSPGQDRRLRGRVRPGDRRRRQRRHQERHATSSRGSVVRLLPPDAGSRATGQEFRVAERHGQHRRLAAERRRRRRSAARSCGTACSSSAPIDPQWETRTFAPAARRGFPARRAWATSIAKRQITSYAAKGTWQLDARTTASTRRSSAIRPRATWGRSAPRRCWRTTPSGFSELGSTAATTRPSATTACSRRDWLVEASFARALQPDRGDAGGRRVARHRHAASCRTCISGGIGFYEAGNDGKNMQYQVKATNVLGGHQLRYGVLYEDVEYDQINQRTGPTFTRPTASRRRPARRSTSCPRSRRSARSTA